MPKDSSLRSAIRRYQSSPESAQALEQAVRAEGAVSLGRAGRAVEESLARLREMPNEHPEYEAQLYRCADAVYRYFVQREMCNLTNHLPVIESYAIPRAVLARVGGRAPSVADTERPNVK